MDERLIIRISIIGDPKEFDHWLDDFFYWNIPKFKEKEPALLSNWREVELDIKMINHPYSKSVIKVSDGFEINLVAPAYLELFLRQLVEAIRVSWSIKWIRILSGFSSNLDTQVSFVSNNRKPGRPPKYGEWVERIRNEKNLNLVKADFINAFQSVLGDPLSAWKRIVKKAARK